MSDSRGGPTIEQRLENLKGALEKYASGHTGPTPEVVTDLTQGIHELSDHVLSLHRRLARLEQSQEQWTTRGWSTPGSDDS